MKKPRIILYMLLLAALWGVPRRAAAQIFAVRANALAVCSATLNVGAEAALTDNWSLELSGYWDTFSDSTLPMSVTTSEAERNAIKVMPAVWVSATGMRVCSRNAGTSPSKPA